ncbi:MAG TPA: ribosome biogenesis GTPase Der [Chitinispirillaceae bacterium]|nr:ribosome biogenesis GTPase Der [Chitinispirillaceae bacterium]
MSSIPVVSIVGRPNVGKSSLFNRIIGKRIAIVDDLAGVTRDRNYHKAIWNDCPFMLVDTGGLVPTLHDILPERIHEQVDIATRESSIILFIVEAHTGPTDLDLMVAKQLRRSFPDRVLLVVNKAESADVAFELDSYRSLGIGDPYPVSAIHGSGIADLLDVIVKHLRSLPESELVLTEENNDVLKLAIVGRPNAGKSSLINKILGTNRMIVDSLPGTTRDSIDSEVVFDGSRVVLIDTAGIRKRARVKDDVEYYSNLRAMKSIERCNVCILMIDVTEGIGVQDLRILRSISQLKKGVLLVWNKWDIMEKDHRTFDQLVAETRRQYMELKPIPMVSISALTGQRVQTIISLAKEIKERMEKKIPGAEFENTIFDWVRVHPHPAIPENPVRFLGARQVPAPFPLFKFFVTNHKEIAPAYERYLMNKIYDTWGFDGCPVILEFCSITRTKNRSSNANHSDNAIQKEEA